MLLQLNEQTRIENPRQYGAGVVNQLRSLLTTGGYAQRDPHRENFYELENDGHTFYIHISPISGEIMLVAMWSNSSKEACTESAYLVA